MNRLFLRSWGLLIGLLATPFLAIAQADGVWRQVWVKALARCEFLFLFGTPGLQQMGQL